MSNLPEIQVSADHYAVGYDSAGRWTSYWVQIENTLRLARGGRALEVGIGNGLAAHYLRHISGIPLTTVDIDPQLRPDHLASIVDLPFADREFAVVAACEVLEHLPYEQAERGLKELRRVADSALISVPHVTRTFGFSLGFNSRKLSYRFELPVYSRRRSPIFEDQHYWELGMENHEMGRFKRSIEESGWNLESDFRNDGNAWHHFFILR